MWAQAAMGGARKAAASQPHGGPGSGCRNRITSANEADRERKLRQTSACTPVTHPGMAPMTPTAARMRMPEKR